MAVLTVGSLLVGLRSGESGLSQTDRNVLALVAVPLAVAVHATSLSSELQASRERLVAAREEERRRLRRDLHDGLGPTLTGVAFTADAAANLVSVDADAGVGVVGDFAHGHAGGDRRRTPAGRRPSAACVGRARLGGGVAAASGSAVLACGWSIRVGAGIGGRVARVAGCAGGCGVPDRDGGAHQRGTAFAGDGRSTGVALRLRTGGRGDRRRPAQRRLEARRRPASHARTRRRTRRPLRSRPLTQPAAESTPTFPPGPCPMPDSA